METKICAKCKQEKKYEEFDKHPGTTNGLHPRCKECRKPQHKQYYQKNKEKWVESDKKQRLADPEKYKAKNKRAQDTYRANPENTIKLRYLKARYGLSIEDYEAMNTKQNGLCAICNGPPTGRWDRLHVDHSHTTNKVRKLLCFHCNAMLGNAKDSLATLTAAIEYLKLYP